MNSKFTTIIAIAALCAAVSAVSCGKDKNSSSSDVILDIKTTTVSAESTTDVTTTAAVTTTKAKATTTTAKTTAAEVTEAVTTPVAVDTTEEVIPEEQEYIEEEPEEEYEEPEDQQPAVATPATNNNTFTFDSIDQPISSITNALGEGAQSKVPSCIPKGDGSDSNTVYSYSGLDVLTYTMGGAEYIGEIDISGGSFATDKGIKVGSSRAEVTAAYPGAGSSGNDLFFDSGDKEIYFYMSGDTVSKITIS